MMKDTKRTDFKRTDCKKTDINLSIPDVYCDKLGMHYACFLGEDVWCEKRALPNRMERS